MKASILIKTALASMLHGTGVVSWKLKRNPHGNIAVLMYHRILPREEMVVGVQPGMVVEPDTLDMHLGFLQKHFTIVPLSRLASMRDAETKHRPDKPWCAITFDDGWFDFHEYAYPILKKHNAPATVFLPTDFIGTRRWFWTDQLGFLFGRMTSEVVNRARSTNAGTLLNQILSAPGGQEERLENAIMLLKTHRVEVIESVVRQLGEALGEDGGRGERAFLTWEEVREMHRSGLVDFGSHTAAHLLLTTVTPEQARSELKKSMSALLEQGVVDRDFVIFSYPNGNYSNELSELVRQEGYKLAVTTRNGWHRQGADPFAIRRIGIHQDISSTRGMFGSRIANLF